MGIQREKGGWGSGLNGQVEVAQGQLANSTGDTHVPSLPITPCLGDMKTNNLLSPRWDGTTVHGQAVEQGLP